MNYTQEQLNCALHGPIIKNPTGLWYTKNASGNYSMYAPSCTCDYSDDDKSEDNYSDDDSDMKDHQDNSKMIIQFQANYQNKMDVEGEEENLPASCPILEKHNATFESNTQKMYNQQQLDCALHGPMIKNPSMLWYTKNGSGYYSSYAPPCTCDYSDDEDN